MPEQPLPVFHTKPFKHQLDTLEASWLKPAYAILWEQGTGKTKLAIDTAQSLFLAGKIDGLLVLGPGGIPRNWITDELPVHLSPEVKAQTSCALWQTKKAGTKTHAATHAALLGHKGLAVLCMTYDGFMTALGKKAAWAFMQKRRILYVADEAHHIKTPKAKRTKSVTTSARHAPYRRLLTGTPVSQGPFDLYSQLKFVDPDLWKRMGLSPFACFKTHFGIWRRSQDVLEEEGYDPGYDQLVGYKNLDELAALVAQMGSRVTKDEVLDLPPKLYQKMTHELNPEQRRLYKQFMDEFTAELEHGHRIDAPLAIQRLLRFQQIVCGYLPGDDEGNLQQIGNSNNRLALVEELRDLLPHKAIFWGRFNNDIDLMMDVLGERAVRYDGTVDEDARARAKDDFQKGDAQWFVAKQQSAGEGLTLHAAKTAVYYSNTFRLLDRLQSEDRPHRIGMDNNPVNYIDLIAEDTVDEHIIKNLRLKRDIAATLTGDELGAWI